MSSGQSPDWLPAGWTMRSKASEYGKKVKCFIEPVTGRKFYSKAQVFQHLEKANSDTSPKIAICSVDNAVNKAIESPDWLPDGWIVEERTRNSGPSAGSKFKVYTDPKTGHKFYSKPEVSRYLEKSSSTTPEKTSSSSTPSKKISSSTPSKKISSSTPPLGVNDFNEVSPTVIETKESSEWLPHGWIVESNTQNSGKKRTVYIDPASGCKFYSKPQVSRYLEKINSNSSPQIGTGSANDVCLLSLDQSTESGPSLKPDVSQNCQMNKNKSAERKLYGGNDLLDNGTFERVTDEKFPPGWVKEIKTRKAGDIKHKDLFYLDPVNGYMFRSKLDALRYVETGDIKMCKSKPMKRDISDLNLMNNDIPHDVDHSTGGRDFLKPEVSQDCKSNQSNISRDPSVVEQSMNNGVVGKNSSEDIPPGWKIEYKIRKMANRVVKDPYYVDPISGYEFRSKPDVNRYLETGDINSCKIKPKKRDANDLMKDGNISPSSAIEVKKSATTRRRFSGEIKDKTIVSKSLVSPEVGRSQRKCKSVSDATMDLSSPTVDILEASLAKIPEPTINLSAANEIIFSVVNDILHEDVVNDILHEDVVNDILHEEKVLGDERSRGETQSSTKSKKKRVFSPPLRSSKRLARDKLEGPPESSLGESSQAAAGNGDGIKANSLSNVSLSASRKVLQKLQTQAEGEVADHTFIGKDAILHNELSNGSGKKLGDQDVTEKLPEEQATEKLDDERPQKELTQNAFTGGVITKDVEQMNKKGKGLQEDALENQLERQEAEKHNDGRLELNQMPIEYPYMEDPCFEFAFKTLTGAIPVEENLSFQDYFKQQAETSQNSGRVGQPDTVLPSFSQDKTPVPLQQLPPDTTYLASENISFTSTSQKYGFEAGCQTKAK